MSSTYKMQTMKRGKEPITVTKDYEDTRRTVIWRTPPHHVLPRIYKASERGLIVVRVESMNPEVVQYSNTVRLEELADVIREVSVLGLGNKYGIQTALDAELTVTEIPDDLVTLSIRPQIRNSRGSITVTGLDGYRINDVFGKLEDLLLVE